jgi:hypothetical protein
MAINNDDMLLDMLQNGLAISHDMKDIIITELLLTENTMNTPVGREEVRKEWII